MIISYFAVFEPSGEGYDVYFPDLPGCTSYGATLEKARKQEAIALGLHIKGMQKDGDKIPKPSEEVRIDPETAENYRLFPVSVSLPENLF